MTKLYSSLDFNINTLVCLLNKVWFELCMYFCKRGRENQRDLTYLMFDVGKDKKGLRYIYQKSSEVTENHQDQGELSSKVEEKTSAYV